MDKSNHSVENLAETKIYKFEGSQYPNGEIGDTLTLNLEGGKIDVKVRYKEEYPAGYMLDCVVLKSKVSQRAEVIVYKNRPELNSVKIYYNTANITYAESSEVKG